MLRKAERVSALKVLQEEKHEAVERGLSGGRLPDSFSSVDCEMYAILAYLRKVCELSPGETKADLKNRKVLILCDCQPCLKSIEGVYRKGNTRGLHRRDRGGMLEAIAHLRSQLGLVVFLWIKSHNGASTSSYPDLAAKMTPRGRRLALSPMRVCALDFPPAARWRTRCATTGVRPRMPLSSGGGALL